MYESKPLLATRAKYRKLSFMLSNAILSGHGWFMSLPGAMGVKQKFIAVWRLKKGGFKLRAASAGTESLEVFST